MRGFPLVAYPLLSLATSEKQTLGHGKGKLNVVGELSAKPVADPHWIMNPPIHVGSLMYPFALNSTANPNKHHAVLAGFVLLSPLPGVGTNTS
jgi:hypothetical protein